MTETIHRPIDGNGHMPQLDGRTDEEMDAIYGRTPFARWSEPMKGDDLKDVLNEACMFVRALANDPGFNATPREELVLVEAHAVLWDLWHGMRPTLPCHSAGGGL